MATNIKNQIWHDAMWDIAKAIGRYTLKGPEAYENVKTIVNSQDLSTETDLLLKSMNVYKTYTTGLINSMFGSLSSQLLALPVTGYWSSDLESYLDTNNFKISQLMLDVIKDNDIILPSDLIYAEGYWEHKSLIINRSNLYSLYHFEIDVSEDSDFSTILAFADSSVSPTEWFYEKEEEEFVAIPINGVPSSYVDRHIMYKSASSEYLERGKEYYFRIRQKDQHNTYEYESSQDTIGT